MEFFLKKLAEKKLILENLPEIFLKSSEYQLLQQKRDEFDINFFEKKIYSQNGEDGILEFKNNNLSILTSSIFNLTDLDKSKQQDLLKLAEEEAGKPDITDQSKYLVDQKIEVLRSLN